MIHVGKASVYKNRLGAMKAFDLLLRRLPTARMFLVHGPASREECDFVAESGHGSAFQFLPPLEEESLRQFYGSRTCLFSLLLRGIRLAAA